MIKNIGVNFLDTEAKWLNDLFTWCRTAQAEVIALNYRRLATPDSYGRPSGTAFIRFRRQDHGIAFLEGCLKGDIKLAGRSQRAKVNTDSFNLYDYPFSMGQTRTGYKIYCLKGYMMKPYRWAMDNRSAAAKEWGFTFRPSR